MAPEVFRGPEEPEEGDYDEVADVGVGGAPAGVGEVEELGEGFDDHDVRGVGAAARVVFVAHGLEKRRQ